MAVSSCSAALQITLRHFRVRGREVIWSAAKFEKRFREYIGVEHAVAVSSCSAALQITLRHFRVRGREVILPTNNFPGVVSAVLYEGGVPVLADIDPHTFCLDTSDALARISPQTAGIIVVHIAGLVYPEIDVLRKTCEEKGLFLIEDASHAHGASIDGRKAGSLADAGCFSFYPTKLMTSGTGGMITTRNSELAEYARLLRHHGQGRKREEFVQMGSDWCMSELHAILGLQQLRRLDENVEHRHRVVEWYRAGLDGADWVTIPEYSDNLRHAYYKLPVLLSEEIDRNRFRIILENEFHVENGTIYDPPCHLQPVFRDLPGWRECTFPKAETALRRQFCPPIHSSISETDVRKVIEAMKSVVNRCAKKSTCATRSSPNLQQL